jgi:tRNA G18 (ribose-2'-O)-methylase SpoU
MKESQKSKSSYQLFNVLELKEIYSHVSRPVIIADNLRTPENIGAILRLAANIGAEKVLLVNNDEKQFKDYRVFRTASGAEDKMKWKNVSPDELEKFIPEGYQIVALETIAGAKNIFNFTFSEKTAFIIGNEVNGISDKLLEMAQIKIFIPVPGIISSLNVSHSLAVAAFEWLRQMTALIKK